MTEEKGAKWSGKKLRTVEALMAQGMGKQRRLESYDAKPRTEEQQ